MIIYDYAYNLHPNKPILAGQILSNTITEISDTIFPNPTTGRIEIYFSSPTKDNSFEVYDFLGRKVMEAPQTNYSYFKLDLKGFSSGTYFICINTDEGIINKKVVVQ